MKRKIYIVVLFCTLLTAYVGCQSKPKGNFETTSQSVNDTLTEETAIEQTDEYEKISPEAAEQAIDSQKEYILLDVRYQDEFDEEHLKGATLIPVTELEERAETELPDKNELILVYCASGSRSKIACETLIHMGYTYVKDIGSIDSLSFEKE